jgi:hypothetical protein
MILERPWLQACGKLAAIKYKVATLRGNTPRRHLNHVIQARPQTKRSLAYTLYPYTAVDQRVVPHSCHNVGSVTVNRGHS